MKKYRFYKTKTLQLKLNMIKTISTLFLLFIVLTTQAQRIGERIIGEWRSIGVQYYDAEGKKDGGLNKSTENEWESYTFHTDNTVYSYSANGQYDPIEDMLNYTFASNRITFTKPGDEEYYYDRYVTINDAEKTLELKSVPDEMGYYVTIFKKIK